MGTTTVSSVQALSLALKSAQAGDVILLESGSYSGLTVRSLKFDAYVTVTSKDAARPATLTDLSVRDSSGLAFRGLEFVVDPSKPANPFQVERSTAIQFGELSVHGTLNADPSDDQSAMLVRDSSNVSLVGSEFQQLANGFTFLDSSQILISGNRFHDIRTDAVRGGGTSQVQISENTFSDFYPKDGDHADAIQFWTTNTTSSARDIVVSSNFMFRGKGEVFQGVFVKDGSGNIPFENVSITGNTALGLMYNGIMVDGGRSVTINHNTVVGFSDMKSWIRVENVTSGLVQGNEAQTFMYMGASGYQVLGNKILEPLSSVAVEALKSWLATSAGKSIPDSLGFAFSGDAGVYGTHLVGRGGDDVLAPRGRGDAWIEGGAGADRITGGVGADYLRGDAGDDEISGNAGADDINGNAGNDTVRGGDGDDWVVGGKDNDLLYGENGADIVYGNMGADTCYGGAGADWIRGGQGDDSVSGGDGNDFVSGDAGSDTVSGGAGADTFNVVANAGLDYIVDFSVAEGDRVRLEGTTSYSIGQNGADVVLDFSGGRVILANVNVADLPSGWILLG